MLCQRCLVLVHRLAEQLGLLVLVHRLAEYLLVRYLVPTASWRLRQERWHQQLVR
jgi:hypothetical protein